MNSWAWFVAGAFVVGSIPFGLFIARAKGVDIRQHGSRNIGATNVMRVLGKGPGILCFVLDVLKGLVPTLAAGLYHGVAGGDSGRGIDGAAANGAGMASHSSDAWWWLAVMAAAILGHVFSPWVGFKGGKGVATGLGAMLGVWPMLTVPGLAVLGIWIGVFAWKRYVSLASVVAAVALPMLVALRFVWAGSGAGGGDASGVSASLREATPYLVVTGTLCALVVWRHRANIGRLMRGEELRVGRRRDSSA